MTQTFSSKIDSLTNRLAHIGKPDFKEARVKELTEQLMKLDQDLNQDLSSKEKRVAHMEKLLRRKNEAINRQHESAERVWEEGQEQVGTTIGQMVDQYQARADTVMHEVKKEEINYGAQLEEEQDSNEKQVKIISSRIQEQVRIVEREMNRLEEMEYSNQQTLTSKLAKLRAESTHQLVTKSKQLKEVTTHQETRRVSEMLRQALAQQTLTLKNQDAKYSRVVDLLMNVI